MIIMTKVTTCKTSPRDRDKFLFLPFLSFSLLIPVLISPSCAKAEFTSHKRESPEFFSFHTEVEPWAATQREWLF